MQQLVANSVDNLVRIQRWPSERPLFVAVLICAILLWIGIIVGTMGVGLIYAILIGLFVFLAHLALIAHLRGSAVQLGPDQFPEIYNRVVELSQRAGLKKVPDAYILQADGGLNAFATRLFRGRMIALYSDLLDACGDDTDARDMIIGHEIGHLRSGHLDWQLLLAPGKFVPFLGSAYSRACEYTCDRWGAALCGKPAAARRALAVLAAGGAHSRKLNFEAYIRQQEKLDTGWMTLARWFSSYPPLSARVAAVDPAQDRLYRSSRGPLRALGIMASFVLIPIVAGFAITFSTIPIAAILGQEFSSEFSDVENLVEPGTSGGAVAPASPTYGSVAEMPAPQPVPTIADAAAAEQANLCHGGNMQACDDLYDMTDVGSPEEAYGGSCGGRIQDNGDACTELVAQ